MKIQMIEINKALFLTGTIEDSLVLLTPFPRVRGTFKKGRLKILQRKYGELTSAPPTLLKDVKDIIGDENGFAIGTL